MKNGKISLKIFIILSIIISLFPPFEWDSNTCNNPILPIKKYDFIFQQTKRIIKIGNKINEVKIYDNEKFTLDTNDCTSITFIAGVDTFKENKNDTLLKAENTLQNSKWHPKGNYKKSGKTLIGSEYTPEDRLKKYIDINRKPIQPYKIYKIDY